MQTIPVPHRFWRTGDRAATATLLGISSVLAVLLLGLLVRDSPVLRMLLMTLLLVPAAVTCRFAALRADTPWTRAGWNWLMLAMVFFGISAFSNIITGDLLSPDFWSPAAMGRIFKALGYGFGVIGLMFAVSVPRRLLTRLLLDTAILLAGSAVIIAMVLDRIAIQVVRSDLTNPVLYRPLVDIALLSLAMVALATMPRRARLFPSLIYLVYANGCLFIGHMGATVALLQGQETSPTWVYAFYACSGLFVMAAGSRYVRTRREPDMQEPAALGAHNPLTHSFWFHLGGAVIPYSVAMSAATLLATVALGSEGNGIGSQLAWAGALAFVLAGGLRHVLSHTELHKLYRGLSLLNRDLEVLVDQRTTELSQRNEELEAIHKVALVSAQTLDLSTVLRAVAEQLAQVVEASYCVVYEYTSDGPHLVAKYDPNNRLGTSRLRLPESNLLMLPSSAFDPVGYRSSVIQRWDCPGDSPEALVLDEYGAEVAMLVPLVAGEHTVGVAEMYRARPEPFTSDDVFLAEAIATHAALATENARAYDKARFAASHDPVTGLLNHRALHEELARMLDRAVRRGAPLMVLMLDLNYFKEFNDRYGHQAGDRMLADIGQAIKSSMPARAVIARYGGDEFTVAVPDSPRENAPIFMATIRERVDLVREHHGFESAGFGVSIGIASYPVDGTTVAEIIARADRAMYADKWRLKGFADRRRAIPVQMAPLPVPQDSPVESDL